MNEVCYVITGTRRGHLWLGRLRHRQVGQPASVEFDWAEVLAREERYGDVIGFYHTHPAGLATPSQRDLKTMRAWVSCLGKPLLCLIESEATLAAYLWQTDEDKGQRLVEVQRFPRNMLVCYGQDVDNGEYKQQ